MTCSFTPITFIFNHDQNEPSKTLILNIYKVQNALPGILEPDVQGKLFNEFCIRVYLS